ncbi:MAG: hypothetical protein HQK54_04280 [Oligoflexales bacterium]|nr:hypothetical protein [Oligoflexales bacterium]
MRKIIKNSINKISPIGFIIIASSTFPIPQKKSIAIEKNTVPSVENTLPEIPLEISEVPENQKDSDQYSLTLNPSDNRKLSIIPKIQYNLNNFIKTRRNPIATTVLVDVKTGKILAMAQGRHPEKWGATHHTALHPEFPAASLFKTVVAATTFETIDMDYEKPIGLLGSCTEVHPAGRWMQWNVPGKDSQMTISNAYGHSCNSFFAKIAIDMIGLGNIMHMASNMGWNGSSIPSDFQIPSSPINPPNPKTSSAHTVGRFAAGFGYVGISAVHAAWQTLIIASNGIPKPITIFKDQSSNNILKEYDPIISKETSLKIREIMKTTIQQGTASFAFRYGRYKKIREDIGGKTGTLTGQNPSGLTSLFVGIYPIDNPEVVVSSVVLLDDLWVFKAANLAAETFAEYYDYKNQKTPIAKNNNSTTSITR